MMQPISQQWGRHDRRKRGQGLVEYALILVLVALVTIAVVTLMGDQIARVFCSINATLEGHCAIARGEVESCDTQVIYDPRQREFTFEAIVNGSVSKVIFTADNGFSNTENFVSYCFKAGNGPCDPYQFSEGGMHTIEVVAYNGSSEVGSCTVMVNFP